MLDNTSDDSSKHVCLCTYFTPYGMLKIENGIVMQFPIPIKFSRLNIYLHNGPEQSNLARSNPRHVLYSL